MSLRGFVGFAVVLGVFGTPLRSHASSGDGHALLLYGPDGPDFALEDRAIAAFNLQSTGRHVSPSVRHVDSALADVPPIDVAGAEDGTTCPGGTATAASMEAGLEVALQHVLYVRVEEAAAALEQLESMLPCVSEPIAGQTAARIFFLQGVALAYVDRDDQAREAFRQALVVYPQLDWEARFPPGPELVFRDAIQAALRSEKARISVVPGVADSGEVWVDGEAVAAEGADLSVAAGRHVLQWRTADGTFATRVLDVAVGDEVTVFARGDVATAALNGAGCGPCRQAAADALTRLAEEVGLVEIHLAELGAVDMLHTFDLGGGTWRRTDEGAVARRLRNRRLQDVGKVTMLAGGAMALTGAVLGITGHARATQLADGAADFETQEQFDESSRQYANSRVQSYLGFTLAGVGGAAVVLGVPLANAGRGKGAGALAGEWILAPGGLGVQGRF